MSGVLRLPKFLEETLLAVNPTASRRSFLKSSGALVVSFSFSATPVGRALAQAAGEGLYPDPDPLQLDTWIVIHPDNTATFFLGKTDGGQGTGTAFRQMMCDELDIAYDKTSLIMGSTDTTPDQGGSGGSDAIERDGWPMRWVAAEARRVLLELASDQLNTPVDGLTVRDAMISSKLDTAKSVSYAELLGGERFQIGLTGDNINATRGVADVKPVNELRVVGQPIQRYDIPAKVDGSLTWAADVKLPGMVHARNVRPPVVGATLQSIDESSVSGLPGFVQVVNRGNYLAVVSEREEQAINAAQQLKAVWIPPSVAPFPESDKLFDYMRNAIPTSNRERDVQGNPDTELENADFVIEADYEVPFQGHTAIGPAHALADPSDGQMTIYSNDMKSYGLRSGVAEFLNLPREQVRVVYMDGPQVYGRSAADDVGFEAAFLAHELGVPVRLQWMRDEETAWDTKGPAYTFKLRGGLDADGKIVALEYDARALAYNHLGYNDSHTVLIAQLMGIRPESPAEGPAARVSNMYAIPNRRLTARVVKLPMIWETPLRTGNLRDPNGPQVTFAFESFIDELAVAARADPVEFRLDMLARSTEDDLFRRARSLATVRAAAEAYGWDSRPSPNLSVGVNVGRILPGRGIAYTFRNGTIVATVAEVEVNRDTGRVWVKRLVCAHDCGLVINPVGLRQTVECAMLHGLSRALWEEVRFDTEKVTSTDWASYPSLRHSDTPESIEVIVVNGDPRPERADLRPYGAGEASHKPMIAAVANAIHDATGVWMRRAPFTPQRVLEGMNAST
ncbi:MAG: molybdopterin cofactor-binding domain-containing protein [Candidatus Rariloculaceae bacterium]